MTMNPRLLASTNKVKPPWLWQSIFHRTSFSTQQNNLLDNFSRLCYNGDLRGAMVAMDSLHSHNLRADPVTYSQLIKLCIQKNSFSDARLIHRHLFSNGEFPQLFVSNTLLGVYVRFKLLEDAQNLFDQMPMKNVVSWTTIISALANLGRGDEAFALLVQMQRNGVHPNMYTFSSVLKACTKLQMVHSLHGCIVKFGLDSDVFVRSSLIDVYTKHGDMDYGYRIFGEMATCDSVVWNSIIGGFAQSGNGYTALYLFMEMKKAGFMADQSTLTSALRGCTGMVLLEMGKQVHVHVLKYDRDLILNNALLDMYCKCGSLEEAESLFQRMSERDVISWSTIISGLAQHGRSYEALRQFELMKACGTKPNYITAVGVLFACSHAGLVEDGWRYFRSMEKLFGIEPGPEHYGCMIDLLGRAGKLEEALGLIKEMRFEPDTVIWRTLLGACRVHKNADLAAFAAEEILRLEPEDEGAYVLLSNIYADSRRWREVEQVRKLMTRRGVRKEPGRSWMEVNKEIHVFKVGDLSHPAKDSIVKELRRLTSRVKDAGYNPDTKFVLHDLESEQQEESLLYHSEKLAMAFGIISSTAGKPIRIMKNLRICGDCHAFAKLVSKIEDKAIIIRDPVRFHHFQNGSCSCGDYW